MKTIVLFAIAISSCFAAFSQINDPKWNPKDFKNTVTESGAKENNANISEKPGSGVTSTQSSALPGQTSSFDPAWANRFQTVLNSVMQASPLNKGASMAVYTPEEGLWTGVSGISYTGVPITPGMRFGIASNSKLFISVAILKLQEQGILTLDDHLFQWIPAIKNVDSSTTIRQLLTHQSGIFDFWNDRNTEFYNSLWADTSKFWSTEAILATLGKPHFATGNGYNYSNSNYILASMVIEAATGKTWVQNLHDLIFDPLQLDSTFVGGFEPRNGPVAAEWDKRYNIRITNSPMTAEFSQVHAAGAIMSTASEMVQWYNALFNGSILSKSSLQMLHSFDPSSLYGLGVIENEVYTHNYSHTGELLGYMSLMVYDIRRKASICILFNDKYSWADKVFPLTDVFFNEYPKRTDDAGISRLIAPWEHYCTQAVTPRVELLNNGSNPLTSVALNYRVDNGAISVYHWTGNLNPGSKTEVPLPKITPAEGYHTFTCFTTLPNEHPEGYSFNDTLRSNFFVNITAPAVTELFEGFDGNGFPREGWTLNSSSILQWGKTPLARFSGSGAGVANNYDWSGVVGQYRDLQLPLINVSNMASTDFSFEYAYSPQMGNYNDSLQVSVSADCGATWKTLFYKGGYSLKTTADYHPDLFYPESASEWKHAYCSLYDFSGDLLIRFRARFGYSNNLYIDNISVGLVDGVNDPPVSGKRWSIDVYPNPFSSSTTLEYTLEHDSYINLSIFNQLGQQIKVLLDERQSGGLQKVRWDAYGLKPGIYYCRLKADKQVITQKIIKY